MSSTKVRFPSLAVAMVATLGLGCAPAAADGLGVSLGASIGGTPPIATVSGRVSVFSFNPLAPLTPLPLVVTPNPTGCHQLPLLAHVLFNTSTAPVFIYADPFCATVLAVPVLPGTGNHVPPGGSWAALPPVAVSLGLGPVNIGAVAASGPSVDLTPVSIFTLDQGPLTSGVDLGGCNLLPPLITHALANVSSRPVAVFVDPACTVPFVTIPAGDGAHVIGDGSWKYADATPAAATKAKSSRRAAACASTRGARRRHGVRAKAHAGCAKATRSPSATRRR